MDNQHRKIKGYTELEERQIDLMNAIKLKGCELGALFEEIEEFADSRCLALGKTNVQQGLMWAIRSVAKPEGFC